MFIVLFISLIASAAAQPPVTVRYFDSRGRAEAARLTLHALEIPYNEVKYARCGNECKDDLVDWTKAKEEGLKNGMLPFGQVPSVTYDEKHLVQSMAILSYICSENERSPDVDVAYEINAFVGGYNDLRGKYGKLAYDSTIWDDGSSKISEYEKTARQWLGYLENLIKDDDEWVGGSEYWTYADILAFEIVDMHLRINNDIEMDIPKLMKISKQIAALPGIQIYLKSDGRRQHQNGGSAHFDNEKHPIEKPYDWILVNEEL